MGGGEGTDEEGRRVERVVEVNYIELLGARMVLLKRVGSGWKGTIL